MTYHHCYNDKCVAIYEAAKAAQSWLFSAIPGIPDDPPETGIICTADFRALRKFDAQRILKRLTDALA